MSKNHKYFNEVDILIKKMKEIEGEKIKYPSLIGREVKSSFSNLKDFIQ